MESFGGWEVTSEDLKAQEEKYNKELKEGKVGRHTEFNYACFLVQSRYRGDVQRGIHLLEQLYQNPEENSKRDFVFFLALGNARLGEYTAALQYLDGLLAVEPDNSQVADLKAQLQQRMRDKAVKAAAIGGGLLAGLGGLAVVGLAVLASKK